MQELIRLKNEVIELRQKADEKEKAEADAGIGATVQSNTDGKVVGEEVKKLSEQLNMAKMESQDIQNRLEEQMQLTQTLTVENETLQNSLNTVKEDNMTLVQSLKQRDKKIEEQAALIQQL